MRAVGITEFGGPEALEIVELPEPEPGPGEVRIRVHAAAVNPTDSLMRSGALGGDFNLKPVVVPGMDAAGVIDKLGDGVAPRLAVGDRVIAIVLPFDRPTGA